MMAAPTKEVVSVEQALKLVEKLESQRCLWDFKHLSHHDRNIKTLAWEFLSKMRGLSKDSVKWSCYPLRHQFRKVRSSSRSVSGGYY